MVIREGEHRVEWPSDEVNTEWNIRQGTHRVEWPSGKVDTQSGIVIKQGGHTL